SLFTPQKAAAVERSRYSRSEHCAGLCLWAHRLFDERVLLRARVRFALGHSLPARPRDLSQRGASHASVWISPESRPLRGAGLALSPEKIRRPGVRGLSGLLRAAP